MHIVSIRFHMFFDDILLGKCSGITFAYICLHVKQIFVTFCDIWHGCKYITLLKKNLLTLPIPSQQCTTTHVFRSPSDKQGTRGCMIYYLQCMNWALETRSQVQSMHLQFCVFWYFLLRSCSRVIVCYRMLMFTTFARQNMSKQILAVTEICSLLVCYMFWAARPFQQDTRG